MILSDATVVLVGTCGSVQPGGGLTGVCTFADGHGHGSPRSLCGTPVGPDYADMIFWARDVVLAVAA